MNWDRIALVGVVAAVIGIGIGAEVRGQDMFIPGKSGGSYVLGAYADVSSNLHTAWVVAPNGTLTLCEGLLQQVQGVIVPKEIDCVNTSIATPKRR